MDLSHFGGVFNTTTNGKRGELEFTLTWLGDFFNSSLKRI